MRPLARASRPHLIRAAVAAVVALAGSVMASVGNLPWERSDGRLTANSIVALAGVALVLLGGAVAVRSVGAAIKASQQGQAGDARGIPLVKIVTVIGYFIVLLWTLGSLGVDFQALLLGGALTGVIIGIAAQQTLGNVFAGVLLLLVRPFTVGEHVQLKSSLGEYDGWVRDMGLFYVELDTRVGAVALPNSVVLASAVGPGSQPDKKEPAEEEPQVEEPEHPERV